MGSGFGFLAGGALKGLGTGLSDRVDEMRKQRLAELEHGFRTDEANTQFANNSSLEQLRNANETTRQKAQFGQQRDLADIAASRQGELADVEHEYRASEDKARQDREDARAARESNDKTDHYDVDNTGEIIAFKNGKATKTGVTSGSKDKDLIAAAEKFSMVKRSVVDPDTQERTTEETVNPLKAANFLRRAGRQDLASSYEGDTGPLGTSGGADTSSPIAATIPMPGQAQPLPAGVTKDQALSEAKRTIAATPGKRAGVIQKLKSWGIDTSGL